MTKSDFLDRLKVNYATGGLSRRDFIRASAATGIGLAGAFSLASQVQAQTAVKGGSLTAGVAHGATTDTLDPGLFEAGFMIPLGLAIHGYLTDVDANSVVQPSVAENWEATPDAKTWTFKIRSGITFHDGRTVTPEDVIVSLNHHRGETSTSAAKPLVSAVTEMRAEGGNTVVIELSAGNADFPAALADYHLAIMPAKDGAADWQSGIGCGAYTLENLDPGVSAELRRNPNHWTQDVGHVEEWRLLSLIDTNARTTALLSGNVDVIDRLDPRTVNLMKRDPSIGVHSVAGNQHYSFPMRTDMAPYDDNNVRQALKYAIDREALVERVLSGFGSVGNDHPIGAGQQFFNADLEQKTYDPDRARGILSDAGISDLKVQLSVSDAAFAGAVDAGVLIREAAAGAGIDVEVVREPNDGYWSNVWRNKGWCASYWAGRPVEDLMFSLAFKSGVDWNESFWSNDRFDALLVEARAELNQDKRREMYFEMQDLVANKGGVAIPMFASYIFATAATVGHPETFGTNLDMDSSKFMERWWRA